MWAILPAGPPTIHENPRKEIDRIGIAGESVAARCATQIAGVNSQNRLRQPEDAKRNSKVIRSSLGNFTASEEHSPKVNVKNGGNVFYLQEGLRSFINFEIKVLAGC